MTTNYDSGPAQPSESGEGLISWASRVNPRLIERLYLSDASHVEDVELADEVGYALLARCQSILEIEAANQGRFQCPGCEHEWQVHDWNRFDMTGVVACPSCGWTVSWKVFMHTYQHKHLGQGGSEPYHKEFVAAFPQARTYVDKVRAIDRLIHCFHWQMIGQPGRPTARELIYAKNNVELLRFLDRLTYGEGSTPELRDRRRDWEKTVETNQWLRMTGFITRARRREGD